jgi:hypothetical protein
MKSGPRLDLEIRRNGFAYGDASEEPAFNSSVSLLKAYALPLSLWIIVLGDFAE